ncbi:hypothetical protein GX50_04736 [[Emmonsia] crescens]|uniref:Uncharacterized protein n=1 Tax=[Emmonsia] crescens TaxID=73230 RepID=A0A2B7ZH43_9EURO|nr:hypothetical protein GX50_04736 [Emmonsia crescens]
MKRHARYCKKGQTKTTRHIQRKHASPYTGRDPASGFEVILDCENYTAEEACSPKEAVTTYGAAIQASRVNDRAARICLGDVHRAAGWPEPANKAYMEYKRRLCKA